MPDARHLPVDPETLAAAVTGRAHSLLREDMARRGAELRERVAGRRILIIGGAGSIGAATTKLLAGLEPGALHVVDQDENGLAELVRDLRSGRRPPSGELRTVPADYGSPLMRRHLLGEAAYDLILNFAAVKHVRSEKDPVSVLHLLETNLLKPARLRAWLAEDGYAGRYFGVSTDKAANPASVMGASKRAQEEIMRSKDLPPPFGGAVTAARFANIAFSNGSLLQGFLRRLEKRQPLAAPADTRRYFLGAGEAAEICALAAALGPPGSLLVPKLDPRADLMELTKVAETVLKAFGYLPRWYRDAAEAAGRVEADAAAGAYPVVITPRDTSGEKPFEEFTGAGERVVDAGFAALAAVESDPVPGTRLAEVLRAVQALVADPRVPTTKESLVALLGSVVPGFAHAETGRGLDERA